MSPNYTYKTGHSFLVSPLIAVLVFMGIFAAEVKELHDSHSVYSYGGWFFSLFSHPSVLIACLSPYLKHGTQCHPV